jgi:hypothetical protein
VPSVAFSYCYADGNYVECHYAECRYSECHFVECHYAECRYSECNYADCRGAAHTHFDAKISVFKYEPSINWPLTSHNEYFS